VRASGAGLGCPDWPRCWGLWIPPADITEIDASSYDISLFNRTKMWIEYVNRIIGVLVGLFVLGMFFLSLKYRKTQRELTTASLVSVVLVVFQGWLGGVVVKSGLSGGMITLHMIMAVILLSLLVWIVYRASLVTEDYGLTEKSRKRIRGIAVVFFLCSVVQTILGSQVREGVDLAGHSGAEIARSEVLEYIGWWFYSHRAFAWVMVLGAFALGWSAWKNRPRGLVSVSVWAVVGLVFLQGATGVILAWYALPPPAQIVHLGLSAVLCCVAFLLVVILAPRPVLLASCATVEVT